MNEDFYINLIYKQLSGEITPAEQKELSEWQSSNVEHKATYEAVVAAWNASGTNNYNIDVDLEDEFSALDSRIEESDSAANSSATVRTLPDAKSNSNFSIWKIAAALALLIGLPFLLHQLGVFDSGNLEMVEVNSIDDKQIAKLPDGSTVFLKKGASIKYPKVMGAGSREVTLQGEAFFSVQRDESRPFIVKLHEGQVEVLGTSFNIKTKIDGTTVHVKTGKVKWNYGNNQSQIMTKNMLANYSKDKAFSIRNSQNADFWRTKTLSFDEASFSEVLQDLKKHFDVQLIVNNPTLNDCPFSSTFKNAKLDEVLAALETIFNLEVVKLTEKKYQLSGGTCQ